MSKDKKGSRPIEDHLLSRWLKGDARLNDEKELRRQASQDEFLAEAWSGYNKHAAADHVKDLDELRRRLQQKNNKKPVIWIRARGLVAAASIALIIGLVGYFQWSFRQDEKALAESDNSMPVAPTKPSNAESQDATPAIVQDPIAQADDTQAYAPSSKLPKKQTLKQSELLADDDFPAFITDQEEQVWLAVDSNIGVALSTEDKSPAANGAAATAPAPSVKPAIQEEAEMADRSKEKKDADDFSKQFENPGMTLDEVVVVSPNNKALRKLKKQAPPPSGIAEPIGGFQKFEQYIKDQQRYPEKARQQGIEGYVLLGFIVNKNGTLSDFEVETSLGYGLDEEAVRLLRKGVRWKAQGGTGPVRTSYQVYFYLNN